jgi:hypothetical protein
MLAKETLNEIPGQLLNYFRKNGITPQFATEQSRQALQQQLSMKTGRTGYIPQYYLMLKQKLVDQCQQMGMDPFEV